MSRFDYYKT